MKCHSQSLDASQFVLMISTLDKIFSRQRIEIFFLFLPENRFDISCKLSPMEIVCMKCQILFSGKNIIFSQKTGLDISCKLSQMQTICLKCQFLFSGKNKKSIFPIPRIVCSTYYLHIDKITCTIFTRYILTLCQTYLKNWACPFNCLLGCLKCEEIEKSVGPDPSSSGIALDKILFSIKKYW